MNNFTEPVRKYMNKEMVRYVIAGGMTTVVNFAVFFLLRLFSDMSRSMANVIAISAAIIFAFFVNKFFVFATGRRDALLLIREFISFVGMRLFAMLVEIVGTNLLCDSFRYSEFVSKVIVQLVVLTMNYIFSKCIVFKKDKKPIKTVIADNYVLLVAFFIPAVFMAMVWVVCEIGPFGGHSLTMVDSLHQYLPFFADYQDKLKNGGSLFYTWDIGMGSNLPDIIAYYMSCPLNFIIVLFDRENLYIAMCLLISLKIALSSMTMASYLGYRCKDKNNIMVLPFSLAYALSNYVIGYSWNLMWMDCILILPLIMQGFEQMTADGRKYKLYTFSLFYGLLCNYYICFMICIFLVLQFILTNHKSIYRFAADALRFAGTSLLAAAMAAFLLIPAYIGLNTTASATRVFPDWEWYESFWDIVKQMFVFTNPIKSQGFDGGVNLYCGSFALLLFFVYLFNMKIKWYDKLRNIVIMAIVFISFNNVLLNYIWHGFHDQYGIPNRFSFLFIFVLLMAAFDAVVTLDRSQVIGVVLGIAVAFGFLVVADRNIEFEENVMKWTVFLFALYAAAAVALCLSKGRLRIAVTLVMALLCLTETVYFGAKGYDSNGTVTIEDYYGDADDMQAAIDSVRTKGSYYRTELAGTKVVDESVYYNMQGVSLFGSTVSNDLVNAMHGLGFYTGANEFLFDGANPISMSVLGIRYVFRRQEDYMSYDMTYIDTVNGIDIYQNEKSLSLGFMTDEALLDWDSEGSSMFDSLNDFVEKSTGIAGVFSQIYPEVTATSSGITITHDNLYSEYYALSDISSDVRAFTLTFDITEEQNDLYIIANCNGISKVRIFVNGVEQNYERLQYQTYHVGHLVQGTQVQVEYNFSSTIPDNTSARLTVATLNTEAYQLAYDIWAGTQLEVSDFDDGYVKGYIEPEEDGLMFTSIPYDEGWTAYVDGEEVEIQTVAGAFIALDLTAGSHTVELVYFPRGLKLGLIFTIAGWLVMAGLLNAENLKRLSGRVKSSGTKGADAAGESTADHAETNRVEESVKPAAGDDGETGGSGTSGAAEDEYDFESDSSGLEEALALAERIYRSGRRTGEARSKTK